MLDTELPTHQATREAVRKGCDQTTVKAEEVADVIGFVLARRHLAINEVLLRPADQLG